MNQQGDITVATFVPTIHGYYVSEIEEQNYCLLKGMRALERHATSLGSELSIFHKRGAFFPEEIEQLSRIGEWKALWEKRLDQLEKFWQSQVMNHPTDVFDQLFIESFPYYLGVAENAIQYVVDTEMDDTPQLTDARQFAKNDSHLYYGIKRSVSNFLLIGCMITNSRYSRMDSLYDD